MANAIPISGLTDGGGGYLVLNDEFGSMFANTIRRESAVAGLARTDRLAGRRQLYNVYAGRPVADFVDEAAEKPVTGAEFSRVELNVKKIATTVIYTEEQIEDARDDPRALVSADVEGAIADLIDAHALGYAAGSAITGVFNSELGSTTATTELGTTGDAFAKSVSAAMEVVEGNGGSPNGVIAASDVRAHLRDSRYTVETTQPVYSDGFDREPDTIYGLPIRYTSNLDGFPAGAGKVAAVVGDFSHAVLGVRSDVQVRFSDQATLTVAAAAVNLWQRNELAAQWETRIGFVAHDLDRMFCKITNAS